MEKPNPTSDEGQEKVVESLKLNDENINEFEDQQENINQEPSLEANSENGSSMKELIEAAKEGIVSIRSEDTKTDDEDVDATIKSNNQLDNFISMIQARLQEVRLLKEKRKLEQEKKETLKKPDISEQQLEIPLPLDQNLTDKDQDRQESFDTNEAEEIFRVEKTVQEDKCSGRDEDEVEETALITIKQEAQMDKTEALETNIDNEENTSAYDEEILLNCKEEEQKVIGSAKGETEGFLLNCNEGNPKEIDEDSSSFTLKPDDQERLHEPTNEEDNGQNNILQNENEMDMSCIVPPNSDDYKNVPTQIILENSNHKEDEQKGEETYVLEVEDLPEQTKILLEPSEDQTYENQLKETLHLENDNSKEMNDLNNNADESCTIPSKEEDTLDLKEKAAEEKQMLDRLISMVQEKINLAKKSKKDDTK